MFESGYPMKSYDWRQSRESHITQLTNRANGTRLSAHVLKLIVRSNKANTDLHILIVDGTLSSPPAERHPVLPRGPEYWSSSSTDGEIEPQQTPFSKPGKRVEARDILG